MAQMLHDQDSWDEGEIFDKMKEGEAPPPQPGLLRSDSAAAVTGEGSET